MDTWMSSVFVLMIFVPNWYLDNFSYSRLSIYSHRFISFICVLIQQKFIVLWKELYTEFNVSSVDINNYVYNCSIDWL